MARPSNPPFALGQVSVRTHPTQRGGRQARGYYTDGHRVRHEISASASLTIPRSGTSAGSISRTR